MKIEYSTTITAQWLRNRTKDELIDHVLRLLDEVDKANLLLVDMYYCGHREGWEPGESTNETLERSHSHLCNYGMDPYTNGGPDEIARMRARIKGDHQ